MRDIASHVSRIVSVLKETDASTRNQRLEGSTIEQAVAAKLQSAAAKLQDKPEATGSTQLDKPHVQPVPTQVSNATGGQLPVGLSQGDASPGRTEEFDLLPGFSTDLDLNASALDFSWLLGESGDTSLSYQ